MRARQELGITLPYLFLLVVLSAHLSAYTLASVATRSSMAIQSRVKSERHSRASYPREKPAHQTTKNPTATASLTALHVNKSNAISEGGDIESPLAKLTKFANKNFFLVGMLFVVGIARLIPSVSIQPTWLDRWTCNNSHRLSTKYYVAYYRTPKSLEKMVVYYGQSYSLVILE
jgi:hypothetical protein